MSLLEKELFDGRPLDVGRDPRRIPVEELNAAGHHERPILAVIRAACQSCCGGVDSEVRRCTAVSCELWPYRMRKNPFRTGREMSDEQRAAVAARFKAAREAGSAMPVDEEDPFA